MLAVFSLIGALSQFEKLNDNEITLFCILLISAWNFGRQRRSKCSVASQNFQTDTRRSSGAHAPFTNFQLALPAYGT